MRFVELEATPIYDELMAELAYYRDTCEHGLSAWLCEGPQHYYDERFERFPF